MKRYGIKYCGGCNPHYDRGAVGAELKKRYGNEIANAERGVHYDAVFVICGCQAVCADISLLTADRFIWIEGPVLPEADLPPV